jgi:membrane-associated phospholipid phosphatase
MAVGFLAVAAVAIVLVAGCQTTALTSPSDVHVQAAVARYQAAQTQQLEALHSSGRAMNFSPRGAVYAGRIGASMIRGTSETEFLTFGSFSNEPPTASAPAATPATQAAKTKGREFVPPAGYWRRDLWHQMGHEALSLGKHDFWHGFKTSYWNVENAVVLTATMGASLAIQGTGVDATVRNRTDGNRALGDMDEPLQLLGHPGTHFAAAGVLWLGSTLLKDTREHEVADALVQALAVNGVSTLILKGAANTRTPDDEHFGWPSGHTSSAFTVAAVLNEYYGPWVGVPSLALAGLVGYQRIDSRVHDFSDVVFGAMLGYVIGSSIAKDDKAHFPELFGMQVIPYADPENGTAGLALLKRW